MRPARALLGGGFALYLVLLLAALVVRSPWLDGLAALTLLSLLLLPGLLRASLAAWLLWLGVGAGFLGLAAHGHGQPALDLLPACVNAALGLFFGASLRRGREPLIARIIAAVEGRERLELPGVAGYARGLTAVWAALFAVQTAALLAIAACLTPGGLLESLSLRPPVQLAGGAWRWYLHVGSWALSAVLLLAEYPWRRWRLRHVPQLPLARFAACLLRVWPRLLREQAIGERVP